MAEMRTMSVAVLVLLSFVAYAASEKTCLPELWEGEFISVSPINMVYGKTAIDVKGQRVSNLYEMKRHHHGAEEISFPKTRKTRLIADFKKGTEYIIFLNPDDDKVCGCVKRPIHGPSSPPFCTDDAKSVKNITIGGKLDVNVYKVATKHGAILVALAEGSNLPVSTVFLFRIFEIETKYFNVYESIKDTSIFDVPPECESSDNLLSAESAAVDQFVLRGRSILHEKSSSMSSPCPSRTKMLKKARKYRTFANGWNLQGDGHARGTDLGEEKVQAAVSRYYEAEAADSQPISFEKDEAGSTERGDKKWSFGSRAMELRGSELKNHHEEEEDHHDSGKWSKVKAWFGLGHEDDGDEREHAKVHHDDDDEDEHEHAKGHHDDDDEDEHEHAKGHHDDDDDHEHEDHHDDDEHEHAKGHDDDDDEHEHAKGIWHKKHGSKVHAKWGWKGLKHECEWKRWAARPVDALLGAMQ